LTASPARVSGVPLNVTALGRAIAKLLHRKWKSGEVGPANIAPPAASDKWAARTGSVSG
jgi:hypothetical protein